MAMKKAFDKFVLGHGTFSNFNKSYIRINNEYIVYDKYIKRKDFNDFNSMFYRISMLSMINIERLIDNDKYEFNTNLHIF